MAQLKKRMFIGLAGAMAAGLLVAGCTSTNNETSPQEPASGGEVDTATIQRLVTEGSEAAPPTTGPAPQSGKTVWWVSCGPIAPDCAMPMESAAEAAQELGMEFHTADGKLNEGGGFIAALQTAIAARPDAIIVHAMDCDSLAAPLQEANELGIPVLGAETLACTGEQNMIDMNYAPTLTNTTEYFEAWGKQSAEYLIAATGGSAKIIVNEGTDSVFPPIQKGFLEGLEGCEGCEVVDTVQFSASDQVPNGPWLQRLRATLVKNSDATAVFIPSDYLSATLGGAQASKEANPDMFVINAGSGTSAGLAAIRAGQVDAIGAAHDAVWLGYAAMDTINRVLAGEELVPQGLGLLAVNAENNLPDDEEAFFQSPIDWRSAYLKLWQDN